jgi:hypothetical protein
MDKTAEAGLWADVDQELGLATVPGEQALCREEGRVDEIADPDDDDRKRIGEELVVYIRRLRRHLDYPVGEQIAVPLRDARWPLLDALGTRYRAETGDEEEEGWKAVQITGRRVVLSESPDQQSRVSLDFDNRMSQRALAVALKQIWPTLRKRGYVRQTRPLKPKAIAQIRQICLDLAPGSTWSKRLDAWNRRHPKWAYKDVYPFQRDFRRAEKQLTGIRYGLEWFYEPVARLSDADLDEAAIQGDPRAVAYKSRLFDRVVAMALQAARSGSETLAVATTSRFESARPSTFVEPVEGWTRHSRKPRGSDDNT